jgi:glycosyltransferase involved in cell wall biosynthesis
MISVVTICRNAGKDLMKTIQSVKSQTLENIDYVLVDGFSDDEETLSIIQVEKQNFNYFISEKDSGIYNAMNKGIRASKGEWIVFLNAGDEFASEDSLSIAHNYLQRANTLVCYADVIWSDKSKQVFRAGLPEINRISDLMNNNFPHPGTFYHSRCRGTASSVPTTWRYTEPECSRTAWAASG